MASEQERDCGREVSETLSTVLKEALTITHQTQETIPTAATVTSEANQTIPSVDTPSELQSPTNESPPTTRLDTITSDTGFSSVDNAVSSRTESATTVQLEIDLQPLIPCPTPNSDSVWTVNQLTHEQFFTTNRPQKPDQLGIIGEQLQVLVNYFPVLNFPQQGLVYKYHIQIKNKNNNEIHRDRRRFFYNRWKESFCRRNESIDQNKIVFDNRSTIVSFQEPLPNIDENTPAERFMGPNRATRQQQYEVIVRKAGNPIDLSLIRNLNQYFDPTNRTNERIEELQNIKQVLSIALHEHCSAQAKFIVNRTFYSPTVEGQHGDWDLGSGTAMWRGFYSCLVFSKGRHELLMNLDVSHTIFLKKQPFLEFLCEIMLHSPRGQQKYRDQRNIRKADRADVLDFLNVTSDTYQNEATFLLKHCENLRVLSQNGNKPKMHVIQKLGLPANQQTVKWRKIRRQQVTVAQYYIGHYYTNLKYPTLPTLQTASGSYVPMECVDVEPAREKKITDDQRAAICRISTMQPSMYSQTIEKIRQNPNEQCFEQDPFVAAWNLNVDVHMIEVPARVLEMPTIVYTPQYEVNRRDVRHEGILALKPTRFNKPTDFPRVWGLINLASLSQRDCEEFHKELSEVAAQRGIDCRAPAIYEQRDAMHVSINEIENMLDGIMRANNDCKFFLIILPEKTNSQSKEAYRTIKKKCELADGFGIVTQMIQEKNAVIGTKNDPSKWNRGKLNNIMLKINTKLNGINFILRVHDVIDRFFNKGHRVMYVGAGLSPSTLGSSNQISLAAVVASADDVPNRYFREVYKQERPIDIRRESRDYIVSMKDIMKSLIKQYKTHRGYPPNAIVIYRDGRTEREFSSIFEKELTAIRNACVELSPVYRPYLTYIVVNERHHTRLFVQGSENNVTAGTVVDSHDITRATTYDFYLNSHHGPLVSGTTCPSHYHVLYDDNKLKPDEVQMLTYALCYTYGRCTRSISIPAPVKYADLLALRASCYVDMKDKSDTESVAVNQETDVKRSITSERIELSSKIESDCPFFL